MDVCLVSRFSSIRQIPESGDWAWRVAADSFRQCVVHRSSPDWGLFGVIIRLRQPSSGCILISSLAWHINVGVTIGTHGGERPRVGQR